MLHKHTKVCEAKHGKTIFFPKVIDLGKSIKDLPQN